MYHSSAPRSVSPSRGSRAPTPARVALEGGSGPPQLSSSEILSAQAGGLGSCVFPTRCGGLGPLPKSQCERVPSLQRTLHPFRAHHPPSSGGPGTPRPPGRRDPVCLPVRRSPDTPRRPWGLGGHWLCRRPARGCGPRGARGDLLGICVCSFPAEIIPSTNPPKSLHYFFVNRAFPSQNNQQFLLLPHLALIGPSLMG